MSKPSKPHDSATLDNIVEPAAFEPMSDAAVVSNKGFSATQVALALALTLALSILWFLFSARSVLLDPTYQGEEVSGASFNVDGGINLRFGGRFLLRPGQYSVSAIHPEYQNSKTEFQVSEAAQQRVSIELRRRPDLLSIDTDPNDAQLLINGQAVGQTPLKNHSLEPGEHRLELQRERYLPISEVLMVEGGGNVLERQFELQPAWAILSLSTKPEGAEVFSGERSLGLTPLNAEVYQGQRKLTVRLERFAEHTQSIDVLAGEPLDLGTVELSPANASVAVSSVPSDAGVLLNGEFRGQTPMTVELVPNEESVIELFKQGYQKQAKKLRYASGETAQIELHLAAALGEITVSVKPADAQITVNGREMNTVSGVLRLPAVPQTFHIRREGYLPVKKTLTPRPGFKQALTVNLLTPAAVKAARIKPVVQNMAGQTLRLIKPGSFTMGASRREAGRRANENLRAVELKRPFYISATEVSNGQFRKFDFKHSSSRVEDKSLNADLQPVVRVTWVDAAQYCNWLSEQEKLPKVYTFKGDTLLKVDQQAHGYRLPTEAEWAWSARVLAGQALKFSWGQDWPPPPKAGNFGDAQAAYVLGRTLPHYDDGFVATAPVGKFTANQHDLYDMAGNVAEWVHDYYAPGQAKGSQLDPFGPSESNYHVVRGSSWRHGSMVELRLSYRDYADQARDDLGFRVARYAE